MILGALVAVTLLAAPPADPVAVDVDGTTYTLADARDTAREFRANGQAPTAAAVGEALKAELLLAVDARRSGLAAKPDVAARVSAERTRALAALFVERELASKLEPTEAQLKEMFHASGDSANIRMAVFASADEARESLKRLAAGGNWTAEVARAVTNVAGTPDGTTGFKRRADLEPDVADIAFSPDTPVGKALGPIQLSAGWAVVALLQRADAKESEFPALRADLASRWKAQALGTAKAHLIAQKRGKAPVTLDSKFLESMGRRLAPTPAEADHVVAKVGNRQIRYREVLPQIRAVVGGEGGHMAGPAVKEQLIRSYADEVTLTQIAADNGFEKRPEIARSLARTENGILAIASVQALAASQPNLPRAKQQAAIDALVAKLAGKYRVRIDQAVLGAAL